MRSASVVPKWCNIEGFNSEASNQQSKVSVSLNVAEERWFIPLETRYEASDSYCSEKRAPIYYQKREIYRKVMRY